MTILTKFSNFSLDYDVIGAVALHHYIRSKERMPAMRTLKLEKSKDLAQWVRPSFIGTSFDVLIRTMNAYCITFELYYGRELLVKNGENAKLRMITKSATECKDLAIVLSPLDIWTPPQCLKKPRGAKNAISSYTTRLDEVNKSICMNIHMKH